MLASLKRLKEAGPAAFPALAAHLDDSTLAGSFFQGDVAGQSGEGAMRRRRPTIGEVSFEIIQEEIEGAWPKAFRSFYVLSAPSARDWIQAHKGLTLYQMQMLSREESLRRAQAELSHAPADAAVKLAVQFLNEEVIAIKRRRGEKAIP
jgi:hypothetical protein